MEPEWEGESIERVVKDVLQQYAERITYDTIEEEDAIAGFLNELETLDPESAKTMVTTSQTSIPVQTLKHWLGQFVVTHYWDVRDSVRLEKLVAVVNFVHYNHYEVRSSTIPDAGYGLFALKNMDQCTPLFRYGGRWWSDNDEYDGTPPRLDNYYMLKPNPDEFNQNPIAADLAFLKDWVLDGERYFRIYDLGRWMNHPPPDTQAQVVWKLNAMPLVQFIEQGMPMSIVLKKGMTIQKGDELFMSYGVHGPSGTRPDYGTMGNVIIDAQRGHMYARHTITPLEYIEIYNFSAQMEEEPKGGKRKIMGNSINVTNV